MNTANLLNLNAESNTGSLTNNQEVSVNPTLKQTDSSSSGLNSEGLKPVSDFDNALKESLSAGQNSDANLDKSAQYSTEQALPEGGNILPSEISVEEIAAVTVSNMADLQPEGKHADTSINLIEIEGNSNNVHIELSTSLSDNEDILEQTEVEQEENSTSSELTLSSLNLVKNNDDANDNSVKVQENISANTVNPNATNFDPELNKEENNDPFAQLNFIEQAKNTTTDVGVDPNSVKDVFQNINSDNSSFKKLTTSIETQRQDSNASVLKSPETKVDSLFSGSLTDQNNSQQGNYQNNSNQFSSNWIAGNSTQSTVQTSVEHQTKLIDSETLLVEEKVDTSKVIKSSSETSRNTISTETMTRTTEFTVKTPILNKGWNEEVNNHISFVAKNGGGIAKIKLNPAHLGPVEASIKIASDGVTVQISANHVTTRDALDLGAARLKEMLQEQGFTQVDVNVSDQGLSKGNRESTTEVAEATNHSTEGDLDGLDEEHHESASTQSTINGVVDYYA